MSEGRMARTFEFTEEVWHKGTLDALADAIAADYARRTNQLEL
jgi:hypothetical protein